MARIPWSLGTARGEGSGGSDGESASDESVPKEFPHHLAIPELENRMSSEDPIQRTRPQW